MALWIRQETLEEIKGKRIDVAQSREPLSSGIGHGRSCLFTLYLVGRCLQQDI